MRPATLICCAPSGRRSRRPWPQLPRPDCVRVFQIVDRTPSKYAVAVESKTNNKKELSARLMARAACTPQCC